MGDEEKRVCIHAKSTVVPSKAVVAGKIHTLSNLDHMMQLHNVHLVYYYKEVGTAGNKMKGSELMSSLRESLSGALSSYPAVCGRLQVRSDGNWEVKCCDAGVRVLEAKANVSIDKWLETADRSSELQLTYWESSFADPYVSSLFCVQLTEFEGGGLAIGLSCGHMIADPSCATLLMKAWGETHRRAQIMHPPFFHPPGLKARPQMNRVTAATQYYDSIFRNNRELPGFNHGDRVYNTIIFKFSHEMVQQCISEVEGGSHKCGGPVSPFEALAALFWVSCTRAQGKLTSEDSKLSICTEFRKIIVAPLPRGFFGNALHFSEVSNDAGELISCNDLSYPARMIHENLFALEREEFRSVIEWLEAQKNKEGKLPAPFYLYGPHLTCANWEEFLTYEAIFFEKHKPLHVSYYVEPMHGEGLILVLPSAEGNSSRTVMVTLPGYQSSKLCSDPDILRFCPTVRMKNRST